MHIFIRLCRWLTFQIRDQLGFARAETNGTLILLLLISCLLALPPVIRWYDRKYNPPNYEADISSLNSTLAWLQEQQCAKKKAPTPITSSSSPLSARPTKTSLHTPLDINTTTSQRLQKLAGIGPTRSARIIKYRDNLGGFVRQEQYQEIYGLDALALRSLLQHTHILSNFQPTQLHINQDDFKTLLRHPYLSYDQVKRIVQYRERQEKFKDVDELIQKGIVDQDTFEKVKAYLAV